MNLITHPTMAALLLLTILTTTTVSQQKRQAPGRTQPKAAVPSAAAPTFDTLIPAESYALYGEVRGVGQLLQSSALNDILEPVLQLAGPPKGFRSTMKWLQAHADEVMTSRLLIATFATAKEMPETVIAIEFASAEEAAKFAKPLNEFLLNLLPPSAGEPSPESSEKKPEPPKPNYYMQQAGSLILLTAQPLTLKKLKPAGSKPLADDINFRAARNRFTSEPIFTFIDMKQIQREEDERRKRYETELAARVKEADAAAEKGRRHPKILQRLSLSLN
jgi:hypothetical protein